MSRAGRARPRSITASPSQLQIPPDLVVEPFLVGVEDVVPGSREPLARGRARSPEDGGEVARGEGARHPVAHGLAKLALDRAVDDGLEVGAGGGRGAPGAAGA